MFGVRLTRHRSPLRNVTHALTTMSGAGPTLYPGDLPSRAVFKFPPDVGPAAIPPPYTGEPTLANPFPIPADIYNAALDGKVPLTIATIYATTVTLLNWYNRRHKNQPWRIAKTRPFFCFVILHNVFLAVYSAVTFVAMFMCLKRSLPNPSDPNFVVGTVDALCKIHGPRGLGDAVTYDGNTNTWGSKNPFIMLSPEGLPQVTDVGRMWKEGLSFWGWWFYLSKFYEVLDTVIILAKGKRSTTLQTYHHAGAMLSMWAGMSYMSPPIWMFVFINSGIHAMMYTYYTVSALGVRVPQVIKRTLTTMQILQFLVGASFAALHLFVSYTVPVSVAYNVAEKVAQNFNGSSIASAISSVTSASAVPTTTGAALAFMKKLVYRAAGDEGLAENIPVEGSPLPVQAIPQVQQVIKQSLGKVVYRTEYHAVPCVDTSGQAFAIYLNIIYLAPLTGLFMRFFVKSYLRRTSAGARHPTKENAIAKASHDAMHGVEREIESLGRSAEDGITTAIKAARGSVRGRQIKANGNGEGRHGSLSPANQKFVDSFSKKVNQRLEEMGEGAEASSQRAKKIAKEVVKGSPKTNGKA